MLVSFFNDSLSGYAFLREYGLCVIIQDQTTEG